jgi:hypothetical protein
METLRFSDSHALGSLLVTLHFTLSAKSGGIFIHKPIACQQWIQNTIKAGKLLNGNVNINHQLAIAFSHLRVLCRWNRKPKRSDDPGNFHVFSLNH